jgi:hypothetical protein
MLQARIGQDCSPTKMSEVEITLQRLRETVNTISELVGQIAGRTAGVRVELPAKPTGVCEKEISASPLVETLRKEIGSLSVTINQAQDILDSLQL